MDSPGGDVVKQGAGMALGGLSAITSLRSGGILNYMMQRERLMNDPGFRAGLVGSPLAAGFWGISGSRQPGAAQWSATPVTSPENFMGPTISTPTGPADVAWQPGASTWQPKLPPLDPTTFLKNQVAQQTAISLQSSDPGTVVQAKLSAGIPLNPGEIDSAITEGRRRQEQAGVGSTVRLAIPGEEMTIGSPYNIPPLGEEEFPSPDQARAASDAHGWGGRIGPTVHGGWKPVPPPTREQQLPPAPGTAPAPGAALPAPGGAGGPVIRGTVHPQAFVRGMVDRGWTPQEAAAAAGNVHVESGFVPAISQQGGGPGRGLAQWGGDRFTGLQKYAAATGRDWHDPNVQMDWLAMERTGESTTYGGSDERGAFTKAFAGGGTPAELAENFGRYVERPARLSDTLTDRRAYAELYMPTKTSAGPAPVAPPPPPAPRPSIFAPSTAYAAEPPPGATVQPPPPPPPPSAGIDREAVVPHVVVPGGDQGDGGTTGYPPPAPAVPAPPPPLIAVRPPGAAPPALATPPPARVMPGIPVNPQTGQPLQTETQEYQGGRTDVYRAPDLGGVDQQMMLRYLGITNPLLIDDPQKIVDYFHWKQALDDEAKIHSADIQRMYAPTSEQERAAVQRLDQIHTTIDHIMQTYTPEERAYFVGILKYPLRVAEQMAGVSWGPRFAEFRRDIAPIAPTTFDVDAKNNTLTGTELGYLAPLALNPRDSADQFDANLQGLSDGTKRAIAFRHWIRTQPPEQIGDPALLQQFNESFDRQLNQQRLDAAEGRQGAAQPPAAVAPPAPASPSSSTWAPTNTWASP